MTQFWVKLWLRHSHPCVDIWIYSGKTPLEWNAYNVCQKQIFSECDSCSGFSDAENYYNLFFNWFIEFCIWCWNHLLWIYRRPLCICRRCGIAAHMARAHRQSQSVCWLCYRRIYWRAIVSVSLHSESLGNLRSFLLFFPDFCLVVLEVLDFSLNNFRQIRLHQVLQTTNWSYWM